MVNIFDKDPDYRDIDSLNDIEHQLRQKLFECKSLSEKLGRRDQVLMAIAYERLVRLRLDPMVEETDKKTALGTH